MRRRPAAFIALLVSTAALLASCGGSSPQASAVTDTAGAPAVVVKRPPDNGDWTRFDYDAQRSGVGPASTGITAANLHSLRHRRIFLDGTVDSSPIELHAVTING